MSTIGILLGILAVLVGLPVGLFLAAIVARASLTSSAYLEGRSLNRR